MMEREHDTSWQEEFPRWRRTGYRGTSNARMYQALGNTGCGRSPSGGGIAHFGHAGGGIWMGGGQSAREWRQYLCPGDEQHGPGISECRHLCVGHEYPRYWIFGDLVLWRSVAAGSPDF